MTRTQAHAMRTRRYSDFLSIPAQIAEMIVDDIRDGTLVPDLEPNRPSDFDERADHRGFVRFLDSGDFDAIMREFRQAEDRLYQFC